MSIVIVVLLLATVIFIRYAFKYRDAHSLIAAIFCSLLLLMSLVSLDLSRKKHKYEKPLQPKSEMCIYQKEHP